MVLSRKVMRISIPWVCVALAAVALGSARGATGARGAVGASGSSEASEASGSGGVACERGRNWWDRERGSCQPCTRCDPARHLAVLYPCEVHRDTVCHSLYNVRLWALNPAQNDSELSSDDDQYYDYVDYDSEVDVTDQDEATWDLQTLSLILAISGCVVFFVVVLVLSLYHAKQWKILKRALKSDVQDLTAKLKLMETGGETPSDTVVSSDHHIYCNIHAGKETLLGPPSETKGLGNVYTQEKHPS